MDWYGQLMLCNKKKSYIFYISKIFLFLTNKKTKCIKLLVLVLAGLFVNGEHFVFAVS